MGFKDEKVSLKNPTFRGGGSSRKTNIEEGIA